MTPSSSQFDDREMLAVDAEADVKFEPNTAPTTNSRLGSGAPRAKKTPVLTDGSETLMDTLLPRTWVACRHSEPNDVTGEVIHSHGNPHVIGPLGSDDATRCFSLGCRHRSQRHA